MECVFCTSLEEWTFVEKCINYNFYRKYERNNVECIFWKDKSMLDIRAFVLSTEIEYFLFEFNAQFRLRSATKNSKQHH